ncbi:unnamed protein product, partial [marine sediment metagenome]
GQRIGNADDNGFFVNTGDIDGNGTIDVLVSNYLHDNLIWLNDGNGVFSGSGAKIGGTDTGLMDVGDVDSDQDLDIYIHGSDGPHRIWLNDGAGSFSANPQQFGENDGYGRGQFSDLDSDGDLDIIISDSETGNHVWLNDGTGSFITEGDLFGIGGYLELADLNNDGDTDAFFTNLNKGSAICLEAAQLNIERPFKYLGDLEISLLHIESVGTSVSKRVVFLTHYAGILDLKDGFNTLISVEVYSESCTQQVEIYGIHVAVQALRATLKAVTDLPKNRISG